MLWFVEFVPIILVGALGLFPLLRATGRERRAAALLAVVLAVAIVGATGGLYMARSKPATPVEAPRRVRNQGYVSSAECRACHPSQYDSWHHTFHRTMTQVVTRDTLVAPRGDETVLNANGRYHFAWRGDELWVTVDDDSWWQRASDVVMSQVPG